MSKTAKKTEEPETKVVDLADAAEKKTAKAETKGEESGTEDEENGTETEGDEPGMGHNSDADNDKILNLAKEQVEIDGERKSLNRRSAEIREAIVDMGEDKDAFKDAYSYFKKKRHERDGYDESLDRIFKALEKAGQGDLFASLGVEA